MYNPYFLKNSDRRLLHRLREAQSKVIDPTQAEAINKQIDEIEGRRKPLHECSHDECVEFQGYVADMRMKLMASAPHLAKNMEYLHNIIQMRIDDFIEEQVIAYARADVEADINFNNLTKPKKKNKPKDLQSSDGSPRNKWMVSGLDDADD